MSSDETLVAKCHCGKASISLPRRPESITQCNCSLCAKTGFRGVYYSSDELRIAGEFDSYVRDDLPEPMICILRCKTCGIATHWEPLSDPPHARMGVNSRLIDPALVEGIEIRNVDGASW